MFFSFGRTTLIIVCMLSATCLWSKVGESAVVTYTNRTAWAAALKSPGATTDAFAGLSGNQASPLVRTNFTAVASAGNFRAATNTNGSLPPQPYIVTVNAGAVVTITLNSPQTAIALQALQISTSGALASRTNVAGNITATVDGVPLLLSTNGPTFFGFTSTSPFTTLTLTRSSGTGALAFDTVEFGRFTGEVLPVPEPSTMTIAGAAIVLAGLRRWRRRSVAATPAA